MTVPYSFANATVSIPLSQLDANFNTPITLGNTAIQLGNTVTTLNNMTLANVTISSGNVTITNVSVTTANVTTANITNMVSGNVAITGGSINGTTLGAATASTANVTTLTTSSTVTINGGTANGVAYLNGSKVLTTGSALTWNATTLGVGGAIVNTAGDNVDFDWLTLKSGVSAGNKKAIVWQDASGTVLGRQYLTYTAPSASIVWGSLYNGGVNSSDLMTLTPTGLGIGTSSPDSKLHVVSGASTTLAQLRIGFNGTSVNYYDANTHYFRDGSGPTNRMILDSSGNLGLGVTPSAWSTYKALQVGNGALFNGSVSGTDYTIVSSNAYTDTSATYKYIGSNFASAYYQFGGKHAWFNAPSGTAGNTISFTQAMTLTSAGDLGIGTTSPANYTNYKTLTLNGSSGGAIELQNNGTTTALIFCDSQLLTIRGATSTPIVFQTNGATERARITSGGDLFVGTTSGAERLIVSGTTNNYVIKSIAPSTSGTYYHILFDDAGTSHGSITSNGTTTAYNTTSDYRLKTVIGGVTNSGARIDALEPIEYEWKANGSRTRGFLAHKFQEVYPGSVTGKKDEVDSEGKPIYQAMQASTSEVIADLVAEIQSLRARVKAIETK